MATIYNDKNIEIAITPSVSGNISLTINGIEKEYKSLEAASKALHKFAKGQKI